jgi:hypothetical protein
MRVMKTVSTTLNPEANCQDCDWEWPVSSVTLEEVRAHVKATKHSVLVVARTVAKYEPR